VRPGRQGSQLTYKDANARIGRLLGQSDCVLEARQVERLTAAKPVVGGPGECAAEKPLARPCVGRSVARPDCIVDPAEAGGLELGAEYMNLGAKVGGQAGLVERSGEQMQAAEHVIRLYGRIEERTGPQRSGGRQGRCRHRPSLGLVPETA